MNKYLKRCYGLLFLIFFLLGPVGTVLYGVGVCAYWVWFIQPISNALPTIGLAQGIAISIFFFQAPPVTILQRVLAWDFDPTKLETLKPLVHELLAQIGMAIGLIIFGVIIWKMGSI